MDDLSVEPKKCTAIVKKDSRTCSKNAMPDSDLCPWHSKRTASPQPISASSFPSPEAGNLLQRIRAIKNDPDLMRMDTEISILKALLERGLVKLEEEMAADGDESYSEATVKRVQSLAMDILSASEKCARVDEKRRAVLGAAEIVAIIDRIKERVIEVVRTTKEDDSPEETAGRIAEAFSSIEIVECG